MCKLQRINNSSYLQVSKCYLSQTICSRTFKQNMDFLKGGPGPLFFFLNYLMVGWNDPRDKAVFCHKPTLSGGGPKPPSLEDFPFYSPFFALRCRSQTSLQEKVDSQWDTEHSEPSLWEENNPCKIQKELMFTGTPHSATFLRNKALEGMGMSAQEQAEKKAQSSFTGLLRKCMGILPLLLLWSALLKGSHTQGFLP